MSELIPFVKYFVEESLKRQSLAQLLDSDINKPCSVIYDYAVNIAPRTHKELFKYQNPCVLHVYPSITDSDKYLFKGEQLVESIHKIKNQAVFEIRGSKQITCSFYGDKSDMEIIDSALRNFYPKTVTEITEPEKDLRGDFFIYDFIPDAPFYKSLTPFTDFTISPLNIIPQILSSIEGHGAYQVIFTPLDGGYHELVKDAIDCEWKNLQGPDRQVTPSLQLDATNKRLEYKSPDYKSYYAVCVRIILPDDSLHAKVSAFISNYSYGSRSFRMLDNKFYPQDKISKMFSDRAAFHSGFLVNSHELTSFLHIPYQILHDKAFNDVFVSAPVGDIPDKTNRYNDIRLGYWVCGNIFREIHLPLQKEIPHAHVIGVSRAGKSVLLSHIAIEKFKRGEAVFVIDPHGDLVNNILRMVPRSLIDKVVVIDFGQRGFIPQIVLKDNLGDLSNPSKVSDDLTESFKEATSSREFWGPRLSYYLQVLSYIFAVTDLTLAELRNALSPTKKGKALRSRIQSMITHPIVKNCLDEISYTSPDLLLPTKLRLDMFLLDENNLRLFTLEENKISIAEIIEKSFLCLISVCQGLTGRNRSSILSGLTDSLINNTVLTSAGIQYAERKPVTLIKDEFYLCPGDLDTQLTGLAKYGLSVIFAHQYLNQVDGRTREVMGTAGTRIAFKLRREDAEVIGREFNIDPKELTDLRKFQAFTKIEDEVVKINTPKPSFNQEDCSREIMEKCLKEYYQKVTNSKTRKKKLTFDTF